MAVVYEIWNQRLGVRRAVKVLRPGHTPERRQRFETEIKVMAQLDHPNIVRIHSVGEWRGCPFIEMEKVDGASLAQILTEHHALPVHVAVAAALVVGRALNYTHSLEYQVEGKRCTGLLHRDLKPANILTSKSGKVRLTDFGIATPVNVSMHTPDGAVVGSLQYISPEQLRGEEADHRADIFSFGCVLYEMLTGFKAFPDRKLSELIPRRLANDYDRLSGYRLAAPGKLKKLVDRCLAKDPSDRPSSMGVICRELGKILEQLSQESPERLIKEFVARGKVVGGLEPVRSLPGPAVRRYSLMLGCALVAGMCLVGHRIAFGSDVAPLRKLQSVGASVHSLFTQLVPPMQSSEPVGDPAALADSLRAAYDLEDLLTIMQHEEKAENYANVLSLYQELPKRKAGSTLGVLLKTRSLEATDRLSEEYFDQVHINDAEFLLIKARLLHSVGEYAGALAALRRFDRATAYLVHKKPLEPVALVCKARCLTALFERKPDVQAEKAALKSWQQVRYAFHKTWTHPYYREAARNCRRFQSL